MSGSRSMRTSGVIAALLVALDQLTKHWAVNALDDRIIDVVGSLRFNLAFNSGMAFGRGQGFGPIIGVLALVVIVGLLVSLRTGAGRVGTLAVGLVVGGALGNIIDRLFRGDGWFRGAVVDFIDLQWWPVFNVADMGVTIGGVLLVLGTVIGERREAAPGDRTPQPDASETAG